MKKFFLSLVLLVVAVALTACKKPEDEKPVETPVLFAADGDYTAFAYDTSHDAPQLTTVTVTIKDGKIEKFYIDTVQSAATEYVDPNATPKVAKTFAFNAQSKKELGYGYKLHYSEYKATDTTDTLEEYETWLAENGKLEWFQQAELVEAALLAKGVNGLTVSAEGDFTNVSSVSVSDSHYTELAKEAVALAIEGKVQSVLAVDANVIWATAKVDKDGNLSNYTLDTIQGKVTAGKFAWNAQTKQQLGFNYKMHYNAYKATVEAGTDTLTGYQEWLTANSKLEWFQQAKVLTDYVEANDSVSALTLNAEGKFTNLSSVSVTGEDYVAVFEGLFAKVK